ncbi:hypothetical protein ACHAWF_005298 [Thalassiosira exigua]
MMAVKSEDMAKVKSEEVAIIDDDPPPAAGRPTIDEDDLQILSAKNAAKTKYPPGCPVWHDLRSSSSRQLDGRRGVVDAVYLDIESGARVYRVGATYFLQRELAYAVGCPVRVRGTNDADPEKVTEGSVVCPKPGRGDGEASYSIQFVWGTLVRVKLGVEGDKISYRKEEEAQKNDPKETKAGGKEDVGQTSDDKEPSPIPPMGNPSVQSKSSAEQTWKRTGAPPTDWISPKRQKPEGHQGVLISDSVSRAAPPPERGAGPQLPASSVTFDSAPKPPESRSQGASKPSLKRTNAQGAQMKMDISVPWWIQRNRASQENLFFYLIKAYDKFTGTRGTTTVGKIAAETACHIRVNFGKFFNPSSPPMTLAVIAINQRTAQRDLENARLKIQKLLLDYVGDDGSRGRLVYDVALRCPGDHLPANSSCRAVRADDPFGLDERCRFITILPLPYHIEGRKKNYHAAHYVKGEVQHRIRIEANGYIKVVEGDQFRVPVKLCEPYLLLMGSSVQGIDKAARILEEVTQKHMKSCFCTFHTSKRV